jgi:hypothetical protein
MGGSSGGNNSSDGNKKPEPIENVSFTGTEMNVEFTEEAVGKTINLIPLNGDDAIQHWTVDGSKTSFSFSLVEGTAQGTMPISSGEYSTQVVEDPEVVSKRSVELKSDLALVGVGNNSTPPSSFEIDIKLSNHGTLPVHIADINVSGVPEPADENSLKWSRTGSDSARIQDGVGIDKTVTFNPKGYPFALGTDQEIHNHTVGNSSSRKCDGKQRQATLFVKTSQEEPLKKPFTYSLSGETKAAGINYYCGNFSVSFTENKSKTVDANQTSNNSD